MIRHEGKRRHARAESSQRTPNAGSSSQNRWRQTAPRQWVALVCPAPSSGFGEKEMIPHFILPDKLPPERQPETCNTPCPLPLKKGAADEPIPSPALQEVSKSTARPSTVWMRILVTLWASRFKHTQAGGKLQSRTRPPPPLIRTRKKRTRFKRLEEFGERGDLDPEIRQESF